jgi:hypothetical protein
MTDILTNKAFDVEHALVMHAKSFVTLPAFCIYEDKQIEPLLDQIRHCHIYIIGSTPKVDFVGATQDGQDLVTSLEVRDKRYDLRWPMCADMTLSSLPCSTRGPTTNAGARSGLKRASTSSSAQTRPNGRPSMRRR